MNFNHTSKNLHHFEVVKTIPRSVFSPTNGSIRSRSKLDWAMILDITLKQPNSQPSLPTIQQANTLKYKRQMLILRYIVWLWLRDFFRTRNWSGRFQAVQFTNIVIVFVLLAITWSSWSTASVEPNIKLVKYDRVTCGRHRLTFVVDQIAANRRQVIREWARRQRVWSHSTWWRQAMLGKW